MKRFPLLRLQASAPVPPVPENVDGQKVLDALKASLKKAVTEQGSAEGKSPNAGGAAR